MGWIASVTCVTAFINRRYPNGSAVTDDRYRMLLGNECGVLVSRGLYSIDQLRNGVSVAALTPHLSVNGSGDIAGLRVGCD